MTATTPPISADDLTLEQQVALRMVVGVDAFDAPRTQWPQTSETLDKLLLMGLGGVIFFRQDFEQAQTPADIASWMTELSAKAPSSLSRPWLSVDEEGGHITRLPSHCFPTFPHAAGVARAQKTMDKTKGKPSIEIVGEVYDPIPFYLSLLGLNCNFCPVLDVNTNPNNPVINMRSFGHNAKTVVKYAKMAKDRHLVRGVLPVAKHAPGHGSSGVDSHKSLPTLTPDETELGVFKKICGQQNDDGAPAWPALMLAHAVYPEQDSSNLPATLSATMVETMRNDWGYKGVLFTDDMCMGAITEQYGAVDAALMAAKAGVDVLLWREATDNQWQAHQALCAAIAAGDINKQAHIDSVNRILAAKQLSTATPVDEKKLNALLSPAAIDAVSSLLAEKTCYLPDNVPFLPLTPESCIVVVEPNRQTFPQYANDVGQPTFTQLLQHQGIEPLVTLLTAPGGDVEGLNELAELPRDTVDGVIIVGLAPLDGLEFTVSHQGLMAAIGCVTDIPPLVIAAGQTLPKINEDNPLSTGAMGAFRLLHMEVLVNRMVGLD